MQSVVSKIFLSVMLLVNSVLSVGLVELGCVMRWNEGGIKCGFTAQVLVQVLSSH